jgi:hypothetical protein
MSLPYCYAAMETYGATYCSSLPFSMTFNNIGLVVGNSIYDASWTDVETTTSCGIGASHVSAGSSPWTTTVTLATNPYG